ncbi:tail assembly protein [Collimonas humicola]|uniref:tail assembly protein n=1 Tax=Collimonas humicola TaxID=2825886 RepID=UPI001B8B0FB9|nr:tail assembly protein [Collimonas humicola]
MREVRLYGHLREQFGESFLLDVASPAEAVRALRAIHPGFTGALVGHAPGYNVLVDDNGIGVDDLTFCGSSGTIKIVPLVSGAKAGALQTIVGAVMIVVGMVATAYGFGTVGVPLTNAGYAMVIGGIATMLFSPPGTAAPKEQPGNTPSYSFNGAVNTTAQGNPVPVCYGRLIVGSQVISAGLSVEQTIAIPQVAAAPASAATGQPAYAIWSTP